MPDVTILFEIVQGQPRARLLPAEAADGVRILTPAQMPALFGHDAEFWEREGRAMFLAYMPPADPLRENIPADAPPAIVAQRRLEDDVVHLVRFPHLDANQWAYVLEDCQRRRINPRLVWVRLQHNRDTNQLEPVIITTIAAFRLMAERTGERDGEGAPWFAGPDGVFREGPWPEGDRPPYAARVVVRRRGRDPIEGIAYWRQCADYTIGPDKLPILSEAWEKGGAPMLGKCAAVAAYRQGWPDECGGLYSSDEIPVSRQTRTPRAVENEPTAAAEEAGVVFAESTVMPPATSPDAALAHLRDDPRAAWPLVDDTTPDSPSRLELELLDTGVSPRSRCAEVIDVFRHRLPQLFGHHFRAFCATVLKTVRENPQAFGVVS